VSLPIPAKPWWRSRLVDPLLPLTAPLGSVVGVRTRLGHVVLTFDDGPEPGATDKVLKALAEHNATATFFVLVRRAELHPGLLREAIDAGHEIALHGIDHRRLTRMPQDTRVAAIADGRRRLEDLAQVPVRWFRPPYGAQTPRLWSAIRRQGLTSVLWGPAAHDWLELPAAVLARRAVSIVAPGSVLLAHDGFAGPADGVDDGPPPTVDRGEFVARLLSGAGERGLAGRSLGAALRDGRPVAEARFSW
jgi:peptidoglycan/xylan/chitin deacetylase (PgdA/CDA1 family)